ncbi:hypothetical protein BGX27_003246, partial [Mortierella sp. AM989]
FINVFNGYSFFNVLGISWSNKGDTTEKMDLGVDRATSDAKPEETASSVPVKSKDINDNYQNALDSLLEYTEAPPRKDIAKASKRTTTRHSINDSGSCTCTKTSSN